MITGGQSQSESSRRWEQKDVENLKHIRESLYQEIQKVTRALRKLNQNEDLCFNVSNYETKLTNLRNSIVGSIPFCFLNYTMY